MSKSFQGARLKDRRVIYLAVSCAAYLALWLAIPHMRVLSHSLALFALTAVFMLAQLSVTRWLVGITLKPVWACVVLFAAGSLWLVTVLAVTAPYARYDTKETGPVPVRISKRPLPAITKIPVLRMTPGKDGAEGEIKKVEVRAVLRPANFSFKLLTFDKFAGRARALASLLTIIAASAFGYLLSFILRHPNIVLPVAAFSAYVDIWTVLIGPTAHFVEKRPHVVSSVSAAMPAPGSASIGVEPMSFIGPADFIFFAMFLGAIYRMNMEHLRTFWIAFPLLTVTMASVVAGLFQTGFPALVTIGFAVIIANYRHFKLKKEEYIAVGIVAVLLVAAIFVATPMMQHK